MNMCQSLDTLDMPQLNYDAWTELVRAMGGRFNPVGIEPNAFIGWVRPIDLCGFTAAEVGCNAQRVERTYRDICLDGEDHYLTVFQLAGRSAMTHNDQTVRLDVGDVALVDVTRPATFCAGDACKPWSSVALRLPRQALASRLGFEPAGGLSRRGGTIVGRLLLDFIRNYGKDEAASEPPPAEAYVQLAVYDLVGALFVPTDPAPSRHADKLFTRVRGVIKHGFADPDFGPYEAAAKAGISLRYLQKLFTQRSWTCSDFIYSFRLDHAARLLHRRASLGTGQPPLSQIAYACGFRDYTHFARKFRRRFGYPPGKIGPLVTASELTSPQHSSAQAIK